MIGDIRRLIYGLRPPALDQLGLAASLRGLATLESSPGTAVTIERRARCRPFLPQSRSPRTGLRRRRSRT